jgi:hypothetical protein
VKTLRINKTAAALAMLLFLTFGVRSLAYELDPAGSFGTIDLSERLKTNPVQLDPENPGPAVALETRHVPRCSSPEVASLRSSTGKPAAPLPARVPIDAREAKPSVPIHACVLLL